MGDGHASPLVVRGWQSLNNPKNSLMVRFPNDANKPRSVTTLEVADTSQKLASLRRRCFECVAATNLKKYLYLYITASLIYTVCIYIYIRILLFYIAYII